MCVASSTHKVSAISFDLDSIATWGRFPRFCVNTYRWGDKFFNSYNPDYVVGTGKRFNIKAKTNLVTDFYNFMFEDENRTRMMMVSNPAYTAGLYLTYMAVSIGYDINMGKFFGGGPIRNTFNFQFNCSLFAADLYLTSNDIGSTITRFGPKGHSSHTDIEFHGINNKSWGLDTYYFFNHKNYSQAAAFAFSKIQVKSAGSFYAGISISETKYDFDFNVLPEEMRNSLPLKDYDYYYRADTRNYALRLGYGYNWVFHKGWTFAISESPNIGFRKGWVLNPADTKTTFSLYNHLTASIVYNHNEWFVGAIGKLENGLVYNKEHTMIGSIFNFEACVGYRFDFRK